MQTEKYIPTWAETRTGRQARHEQRKRDTQAVDKINQDYSHRWQQAERLAIRSYGDEQ